MKVNKKILASIVTALVLSVGSASAYVVMQDKPVESVDTQASKIETTPEEKAAPAVEETVEAPVEVPSPAPVEQTPEPTPAPAVLSSQEYAEMYLNLAKYNQSCFNAIVAAYPHRFTEDVREVNVKALRAFADPCATGIDIPEYRGMNRMAELLRAQSGIPEFWDRELAKQYH